MNSKQFRDIISGTDQRFSASVHRSVFAALEVPYTAAVSFRNFLYNSGFKKTHRADLPVISVGNLTLGGTGKTPMTAYLAEFLQISGHCPGIISRGYKKTGTAKNTPVNDEFQELALRLPDVLHIQRPNRLEAARAFSQRTGSESVDVLILDDAFQHRRIARNLDIVLLDAAEPFGNERLFPRGTLREPLNGLKRADVVLLSRADLMLEEEREQIKHRVRTLAPQALWGEVMHQPEYLFSASQNKSPLSAIQSKKALAFCGIGNPGAFAKTLESCGVSIERMISFPDHYDYKNPDLDRLAVEAEECFADVVLCTMKDIVKIDRPALNSIPLYAVSAGIRFLSGETDLQNLLAQKVARP